MLTNMTSGRKGPSTYGRYIKLVQNAHSGQCIILKRKERVSKEQLHVSQQPASKPEMTRMCHFTGRPSQDCPFYRKQPDKPRALQRKAMFCLYSLLKLLQAVQRKHNRCGIMMQTSSKAIIKMVHSWRNRTEDSHKRKNCQGAMKRQMLTHQPTPELSECGQYRKHGYLQFTVRKGAESLQRQVKKEKSSKVDFLSHTICKMFDM